MREERKKKKKKGGEREKRGTEGEAAGLEKEMKTRVFFFHFICLCGAEKNYIPVTRPRPHGLDKIQPKSAKKPL
jgi:hypothetical protein